MTDPVRPVVELHDAYVWDCDSCGRENFERAVVVAPESLDPETRAALADVAGDDWITGDFTTRPDVVRCRACGAEFDAEDADDLDDLDDDGQDR